MSWAVGTPFAGQDSASQSSIAKSQLQDPVDSFNATPLQVIDVDGAPLQVSGANFTSIKTERNDAAPVDSRRMIRLTFAVVNRADRTVSGLGLQFTNTRDNNTFFLYYSKQEIEEGKSKSFEIPSMWVIGDSSYLAVQVSGAQFHDGSTWGDFPFPQPRHSSASTASTTALNTQQVDSKPRVLNSAQPRYTEEARKNHVLGAVVLQVLVGDDGAVKQVKVTNSLPDGLTAQAIRSAYELKFEPARKDGHPVEYWMPLVVEFNLK